MARATIHLRFNGITETAFLFYKSVFGTDFSAPTLHWEDMGEFHCSPLTEEEKKLVLHIELPITAGCVLSGSDYPEEQGFTITTGDNFSIHLECETREEAEFLFDALSEGGKIELPICRTERVSHYTGHLVDRFGIHWNFTGPMKSNRRTETPNPYKASPRQGQK